MDEAEYREMKGLRRNNANLAAIVSEKNGVIKALKASNDERQKIIDELMDGLLKKEKEIIQLRRRVKYLEAIMREYVKT